MLNSDIIVTTNSATPYRFLYPHIILIWLPFFPTSLIFMFFFNVFSSLIPMIIIIGFLPVSIVLYYGIFMLFLLFFSKLFLIIINLIHKPKEGFFMRSLNDKDYLFYVLRKNLKGFILKIYNYFPLPWAKLLALRTLDIKVPYNSGVLDSYIDSDFVIIKNNVILGEGSIIMSSMIVGDFFLIRRVILNEGSTIGAFSVISPGTIVEKGAILGMGSFTTINQRLKEHTIHIGRPAKVLKETKNNLVPNQK